ncbi:3,4-dihydroxy 2-butanone 4-phosphate synthase/GTP cyclohydrolase II [Virgibacillus halotolerans]|uniref:bifunctional 3,4-dihydroxy-2-butanone-4-phosphate synthase/GTP cyclohydrolase II n=1 Tax=Virgibacillus halotolerans TaxID=1071053 RepID=UPI001960AB87|nr:bifunctional 3,4-dihydroxy-2-butanone-4-phosphate synthase/GTP cyclohydrolase II [Virgibacillus halotolerans]MBM7602023.1 3,4-dihydroxy 2-butanone 4-phosphate synthase/GTP cyclohydrolase II [Virgibacillus halotolerans]
MFHTIEAAISDLKKGKTIIVVDDENRENEGDFVALSEKATPEVINFMITHGRGLVCTAINEDLAEKVGLSLMMNQSTDPLGTAFTTTVDHVDTTTGISAGERSKTIQALVKPGVRNSDFKQPGHVFPLIAKSGGVLTRPGHTEASVDLAVLSGASPSGTICEIINEDGTMARVPDLQEIAKRFDLKIVTIEALIAYRKVHEKHIKREVETILPTEFGEFKMVGYSNDLDDKEHIALVKGDIDEEAPVLTRIHSECLTGDVFGSHRCDCGPQLHEALKKIEAAGSGVLVYMRQEGRGIGLLNKLRAYQLQDDGLDTVEANEQLGFAPDLREYDFSAQILKDLGVENVRLLTNNPEKMDALEAYGINVVSRIPIQIDSRQENDKYMKTKFSKMGHILTFHNE